MSVDVLTYFANLFAESKRQENSMTRRMSMLINCVIPLFSLLCLAAITIWILIVAITDIRKPSDTNIDVLFLLCFGVVNLAIDIISFLLFYFNFDSVLLRTSTENSLDVSGYASIHDTTFETEVIRLPNLNMLSALSHVGADALRTISMLLGATACTLGMNCRLADSWAAIACSVTIIFIIIPQAREINRAFRTYNYTESVELIHSNSSRM